MVVSMDRWEGKVAIVTGASSGIGRAIAEELVEEGLQVVGIARRKHLIEQLSKTLANKKGKLYAVQCDITKENDILKAFKWIEENLGHLHILINCAGKGQPTTLYDGNTQMWKQILDTNVLGLCIATREAIKIMRANNIDGHIIHMNSVAGHSVPNIPGLNVYIASKHAVTALAETLRQELASIKSKIKITSLSPGFVMTEMCNDNDYLKESCKTVAALEPKDIADCVIYILSTPPHVQINELMIKPVGEAF